VQTFEVVSDKFNLYLICAIPSATINILFFSSYLSRILKTQVFLHTRESSTQNNKYQVSQKHICFSWWWTHNCPKHVEIDKYTKNKLCTKLTLFTWLCKIYFLWRTDIIVSERPRPRKIRNKFLWYKIRYIYSLTTLVNGLKIRLTFFPSCLFKWFCHHTEVEKWNSTSVYFSWSRWKIIAVHAAAWDPTVRVGWERAKEINCQSLLLAH